MKLSNVWGQPERRDSFFSNNFFILNVRVTSWLVAAFYKQSHCFSLIPRKNIKKRANSNKFPLRYLIGHAGKKEKRKHPTVPQSWNRFIAEGAAYLLLHSRGRVVQIYQRYVLKMGASHPSPPAMMDR